MHDPNEREKIGPRDVRSVSSAGDARPLGAELQAIEAALAQLRPRTDQLKRDRLLFLAGQASVVDRGARSARDRSLHWFWPTSSAAMTGVAAALLVALVMRSDPPAVEKLVRVGPSDETRMRGSPTDIGLAAAATDAIRFPPAPPGVWMVKRQFQLTDDLLGPETIARSIATLPDYQPAAAGQPEILSSRSFKELLDENGKSRGASDQPRSPSAHAPGAKS
jgi:hypothetical protein